MNLRQYFKNLSFLFIINFAIKPIWIFAVERKYQLWLGQEAYGKYFSFLSLLYILSVILDLGLHNYAVKLISEKGKEYKFFLSELWATKIILLCVFILAVLLTSFIQRYSFDNSIYFFLIAIELLTFSMYQFLRCFSQGLQMHKLDSLLSSLDRIFLVIIGGGILFLFYGENWFSLTEFILFHIISYITCFLIVWWYLKSEISFSLDHFSGRQLLKIVKEGYPLIFVTFLMVIYTRIDAVLLRELVKDGDLQCGILAYSYRIIDSAFNALALLSVFLLPTVAFFHQEEHKADVRKVVLYSFGIATMLSFGFIGTCFFFSDQIYARLYHTTDIYALEVFRVQLFSILGVGWMYVFGSYLTAIGKYVVLIIIVGIGVILSLMLNMKWIPEFGALGAARASTIVQFTMGLLHAVAAVYYLYFKKDNVK